MPLVAEKEEEYCKNNNTNNTNNRMTGVILMKLSAQPCSGFMLMHNDGMQP